LICRPLHIKRYLVWKIRQAQKGRIPVGPRGTRRADGEAPDFKVW